MDFIIDHLLTLILFVPTAAALLMVFLPKDRVTLLRWWALIASLIPFGLTLVLWANFVNGQSGF
ncbi:MAG: hypothetical protein AAGU05_17315, partial [Anaerolineaceae bacterium]